MSMPAALHTTDVAPASTLAQWVGLLGRFAFGIGSGRTMRLPQRASAPRAIRLTAACTSSGWFH